MRLYTFMGAVSLAASVIVGFGSAMAQTTPTATPTPSMGSCSINLPDGSMPQCATGAEAPPAVLGVSGGNYNDVGTTKAGVTSCGDGTLGALVQDSSGQYVLSSNHVLARTSSTSGSASAKEPIVQPGLVDLGCWQDPTDAVAELSKWTPLQFKKGTNQMDAAIAKVVSTNRTPVGPSVPGIDPLGRILNISPTAGAGQISTTPFNYNNLIDGLPVIKMGKGSCLTTGRIDAFDAMGFVVYPPSANPASSGTAFFDHQILVFGQTIGAGPQSACSFASQEDSGAMVLTADFTCPQAIGILFAAASGATFGPESGGEIVAVSPVQTILTKFKVTLVGQQCTSSLMAQHIDASSRPEMSAALRASIETVREVKRARGRRLLANHEVSAVGIGSGDNPQEAVLNVYLEKDTPEIRHKVLAQAGNVKIKFKHAPKFHAL